MSSGARTGRRGVLLVAALCALVTAATAPATASAAAAAPTTYPATAEHAPFAAPVARAGRLPSQPNLTALRIALGAVRSAGSPGVFARVQSVENGRLVANTVSVGTGDLATGGAVDPAGRFRIGSITKSFDTVLVLKLVEQGEVGLDQPVSRYLPAGTLPASWPITVRQVLGHTSGLYDYTDELLTGDTVTNYQQIRSRTYNPASLVAMSVKHGLDFTPGSRYEYSNTNFVLIGLLLQYVTGASYPTLLQNEIIKPLGLTGTSFVVPTETIAGPHAIGYLTQDDRTKPLFDATDQTASWIWTAGAAISDTADLDTYLRALATGKLLPASLVAAMETGRAADSTGTSFYGLGTREYVLPCGVDVYGHDGIVEGYETYAYTTKDGSRQLTISADASNNDDVYAALRNALTPAFCDTVATPAAQRAVRSSAVRLAAVESRG